MAEFKPLKVQSFKDYVDGIKEAVGKFDVFRTKDSSRLYVAGDNPSVVLALFSEKIQSKADITAETVVGTFLNANNEEVLTIYNPGAGKEAEFSF